MSDRIPVIDAMPKITGPVELPRSTYAPVGEKLILNLEDGRRLSVFVQGDGTLTAAGCFFS